MQLGATDEQRRCDYQHIFCAVVLRCLLSFFSELETCYQVVGGWGDGFCNLGTMLSFAYVILSHCQLLVPQFSV
jgi:hypothetical protein